jgi:hypothetical protein
MKVRFRRRVDERESTRERDLASERFHAGVGEHPKPYQRQNLAERESWTSKGGGRRPEQDELTLINTHAPRSDLSSQIAALRPDLSFSLIHIPFPSLLATRQRNSNTNDCARSSRFSAVASCCRSWVISSTCEVEGVLM